MCLLAGLQKKTTRPIFTKFDGKVICRPVKKSLDFGGNLDHIMLGLGLGLWLWLRLGGGHMILR